MLSYRDVSNFGTCLFHYIDLFKTVARCDWISHYDVVIDIDRETERFRHAFRNL